MIAAWVGIPGIFVPVLDMGGVGVTWTVMTGRIAAKSCKELSPELIARFAAAAVSAVSAYMISSKGPHLTRRAAHHRLPLRRDPRCGRAQRDAQRAVHAPTGLGMRASGPASVARLNGEPKTQARRR